MKTLIRTPEIKYASLKGSVPRLLRHSQFSNTRIAGSITLRWILDKLNPVSDGLWHTPVHPGPYCFSLNINHTFQPCAELAPNVPGGTRNSIFQQNFYDYE